MGQHSLPLWVLPAWGPQEQTEISIITAPFVFFFSPLWLTYELLKQMAQIIDLYSLSKKPLESVVWSRVLYRMRGDSDFRPPLPPVYEDMVIGWGRKGYLLFQAEIGSRTLSS